MKSKFFIVLLVMIMGISASVFTACGGEHKHDFKKVEFVEPTLTEQGYTVMKCSCGEEKKIYTGINHQLETEENCPKKVLFVGNSYTIFFEGVDFYFKKIAESNNYKVETGRCAQGYYFLDKFANETSAPVNSDRLTVHEELDSGNYDVVFLQEHSLYPINNQEIFFDGARKLNYEIQDHNGKTVFYQTWARHPESESLKQYGWTNKEMTYLLGGGYEAIAEELSASLSPVGSAFYLITSEHPEIEIYHSDKTHPSRKGLYLASLCHYATVYGKSPVGITYKPDEVTTTEGELFQKVAHRVVFGGSIIPPEYKISTLGE